MKCARAFLVLFILLVPIGVHGVYRDAIGWNRLVAERGEEVPLGRGIGVSLIESSTSFAYRYQPDAGNFEFAGKAFSMKSGESGVSAHATVVGQLFFGTHSSMAREIETIDVYHADDWLLGGFLRTAQDVPPAVETRRVQNHSWAGGFSDDHAYNIEAIRRLDFTIERDRFVAVAALSNDTGVVRPLLAHAYNAIAVGRPNGEHSRGGTWFDEAGRVRPDLVTPGGFFTSYSAPVVSSAAAILLEEADGSAGLVNARYNPQVIKSVLMAGATKGAFPDWSRSDLQPLDPVFGAGQLNIYSSYRILTGGAHEPAAGTVPEAGWHLGSMTALSETDAVYFFAFDHDQESFTANLSWNRLVDLAGGTSFTDAEIILSRLELRLFETDGSGVLGDVVQISCDPVNNSQHLYLEGLPSGEYALIVSRIDEGMTDNSAYALAWNAVAAEPVRYADWKGRFFSAAELDDPDVSGPDSDPDRDAVANLLEYAMDGDPRQPSRSILPTGGTVVEEGTEYLTITFVRTSEREDIQIRVDASSDRVAWVDGATVLIQSEDLGDGRFRDTYRDSIPIAPENRQFLRLTVLLEPPVDQ